MLPLVPKSSTSLLAGGRPGIVAGATLAVAAVLPSLVDKQHYPPSLTGQRPGMVDGATGDVAVVLPSLVDRHGVGSIMFYVVMLPDILILIIIMILKH